MSRLLVTGASGDLGRPLTALAASTWDVVSLYRARRARVCAGQPIQIDLRDADATIRLFDDLRPDVVIHAAISEHAPDHAEAIPQAAESVVRAALRLGCRLIFLSTDMVFDGTRPLCDEGAPPAPTSVYGKTKVITEALVRQHLQNHVIVRTSLIYDFTPDNRQAGWMLGAIARGEVISLFTDEYRCPIWARNLSQALLELATHEYTGTLHVAGPERINRWDYGRALLGALGVDADAHTRPALLAELAPARVPDIALDVSRARQVLKTPLLAIGEAIEIYRSAQET